MKFGIFPGHKENFTTQSSKAILKILFQTNVAMSREKNTFANVTKKQITTLIMHFKSKTFKR